MEGVMEANPKSHPSSSRYPSSSASDDLKWTCPFCVSNPN